MSVAMCGVSYTIHTKTVSRLLICCNHTKFSGSCQRQRRPLWFPQMVLPSIEQKPGRNGKRDHYYLLAEGEAICYSETVSGKHEPQVKKEVASMPRSRRSEPTPTEAVQRARTEHPQDEGH